MINSLNGGNISFGEGLFQVWQGDKVIRHGDTNATEDTAILNSVMHGLNYSEVSLSPDRQDALIIGDKVTVYNEGNSMVISQQQGPLAKHTWRTNIFSVPQAKPVAERIDSILANAKANFDASDIKEQLSSFITNLKNI